MQHMQSPEMEMMQICLKSIFGKIREITSGETYFWRVLSHLKPVCVAASKAVTSVSGHRPPMKSQVKSILVVNLVLDRVGMLFIIIGLNICWWHYRCCRRRQIVLGLMPTVISNVMFWEKLLEFTRLSLVNPCLSINNRNRVGMLFIIIGLNICWWHNRCCRQRQIVLGLMPTVISNVMFWEEILEFARLFLVNPCLSLNNRHALHHNRFEHLLVTLPLLPMEADSIGPYAYCNL